MLDLIKKERTIKDESKNRWFMETILNTSGCPEDIIKYVNRNIESVKFRASENQITILENDLLQVSNYRDPKDVIEKIKDLKRSLGRPPGTNFMVDGEEYSFDEIRLQGRESQKKREKTCHNVDHRKKLGHTKYLAQGGTRWCYAIATTDLLNFKFQEDFSPVSIADSFIDRHQFIHFLSSPNDYREDQAGGLVSWAVKDALEDGLCLRKDLKIQVLKGGEIDKEFYEFANALRKISSYYYDYPDSYLRSLGDFICEENQGRKFFPNFSLGDFKEIFRQSNKDNYLSNLIKKSLKGRRLHKGLNLDVVSAKVFPLGRNIPQGLIGVIDEQLNRENIVTASFTISLFKDHMNRESPLANVSSLHTNSVIGRRFNKKTNSCEYLFRNTWGQKDEGNPKIMNETEEKGALVWVPEEDLERKIVDVTYIK
jgi:hypothetical protein